MQINNIYFKRLQKNKFKNKSLHVLKNFREIQALYNEIGDKIAKQWIKI